MHWGVYTLVLIQCITSASGVYVCTNSGWYSADCTYCAVMADLGVYDCYYLSSVSFYECRYQANTNTYSCPDPCYSSVGSYCDRLVVTTCPAGSYCNTTDMTSPIACPDGQYTPAAGATSSSMCVPCEKGFFCSGGARQACGAGTYSAAAAAACLACPSNSWSGANASACTANVGYVVAGTATRFPPAAMTADSSTVNSEAFVASASNMATGENPYYAFSGVLGVSGVSGNQWSQNGATYATTSDGGVTHTYSGTVGTVVDGVTVLGEWLQLQTTNARVVGSFSLYTHGTEVGLGPRDFTVVISNDGTSWSRLGAWTGAIYAAGGATRAGVTFSAPIWASAKFFRIITTRVGIRTSVMIDEWKLFEAQISPCTDPSPACGAGTTKRCSAAGAASAVCCVAGQYFVEGVSTSCQSCPAGFSSANGSGTSASVCNIPLSPLKPLALSAIPVVTFYCQTSATYVSTCVGCALCNGLSSAIDGDITTIWNPQTGGNPQVFTLTFQYWQPVSPRQLYMVDGDSGHGRRGPFLIEASNSSGSGFVTVTTSRTYLSSENTKTIDVSTSIMATYWRVTSDAGTYQWYLAEISFNDVVCSNPWMYIPPGATSCVCAPGFVPSQNAMGGDITTNLSGYRVHAFVAGSVNLTFLANTTADVLIIGGGGGGGNNLAGGGGAGALVFYPNYVFANGSYNVTVGAGGLGMTQAAGFHNAGLNGGNSVISFLRGPPIFTAVGGGGGGGGGGVNWDVLKNGQTGGCGGGGGSTHTTTTPAAGSVSAANYITTIGGISPGTTGIQQFVSGKAGGAGTTSGGTYNAGGGGGVGTAGGSSTSSACGVGGDGLASVTVGGVTYNFATLFGAAYTSRAVNNGGLYYIGGGGGGGIYTSTTVCVGGKGGGGNGASTSTVDPTATTANTGSGGGGSGNNAATNNGANGAAGLVLIRYAVNTCQGCAAGMTSDSTACSACGQNQVFVGGTGACVSCPAGSNASAGSVTCASTAGNFLSSSAIRFPAVPMTSATSTVNGESFAITASSSFNAASLPQNTQGLTTATDEWSTGLYYASGVYSQNAYTVVDGTNVYGEWLQLQCGSLHVLGQYSLKAHFSLPLRMPSNFMLAVSNDGVLWSSVDARTSVSGWVAASFKTFSVSKLAYARYFRLIVQSSNGGDGYVSISKWVLSEGQLSQCPANSRSGTGASTCIPNPGYYDISGAANNLYRRFTYESFDNVGRNWNDLSPNLAPGTPAHTNVGSYGITPACETGNGAAGNVCYWKGIMNSQGSGVTQPDADYVEFGVASIPSTFTFCTVERFTSPTIQKRIIESSVNSAYNWLIGLTADSSAGVLLDPTWKASSLPPGFDSNNWLIACTQNAAPDRTYFNGYDVSAGAGGLGGIQFAINGRMCRSIIFDSCSPWGMMEISIWSSALSAYQMQQISAFYASILAGNISQSQNMMNIPCTGSCTTGQTLRCSPTGTAVCCSAGQFFVDGTSTACQTCAAGTFSADGSTTACALCPVNTFSVTAGTPSCTSCISNSGSAPGSTSCVANSGYFLPGAAIVNGGIAANASFVTGSMQQYFAFTATSGTNTIVFPVDVKARVLIIGGGGGGGVRHSGGGGAGAMIDRDYYTFLAGRTYTITVGTGGAGKSGTGGDGNPGSDSWIKDGSTVVYLASGGCGGAFPGACIGTISPNTPSGVFVYAGGGSSDPGANTCSNQPKCYAGPGGGGAGSAGTAAVVLSSGSTAGSGGNGAYCNITGVNTLYAGGGGGGVALSGGSAGSGGSGGGGAGSKSTATAGSGVANTGSGGGGSGFDDSVTNGNSGAGGSGIVVLAFGPFAAKTCNAGQFFVSGASTSCQSCAAGTFSPDGSQTTCLQCPANATSFGGNGLCTCNSTGYYHNATTGTCIQCGANTYSAVASICQSCPNNTWSTAGATTCTPNAGYYFGTRFPPSAMSANSAVISGTTYTASSCQVLDAAHGAYAAFDRSLTTGYVNLNWRYQGAGNTYSVPECSTTVNGVAVGGEWLQLKSTGSNVLTGYAVNSPLSGYAAVYAWVLAGSNDGTTWTQIESVTTQTSSWSTQYDHFYNGNALLHWKSFSYYRIIITQSAINNLMSIVELKLFGSTPSACLGSCAAGSSLRCAPTGTAVCCGAGQFFVEGASTACQSCAAGTFSVDGSQTACLQCPANTTSTAGSGTCTCAAGLYHNTTTGTCVQCAANTYSIGSTLCLACPSNTNSTAGASACRVNAGFYDLGASLMAYYPFNPTNFLADVSGKLGSLTSPSMPASQSSGPWANAGSALFVQANSQYFKLPAMTLPDPFTVCHWYFVTAGVTKGWERLWDFGNAFMNNQISWYRYDTGYDLRVAIYSGSSGSVFLGPGSESAGLVTNALSENSWQHICLGTDGRRFVLWKNGAVIIDNSVGLSAARTVLPMPNNYIGNEQGLGSTKWGGAVDEFRIYNRLLTTAEVGSVFAFQGDSNTAVMPVSCSPSCSGTGVVGRCTLNGLPVCCGQGTFLVEGVSTACQTCAAGTFSVDGGQTMCSQCPINSTSATGSGNCTCIAQGFVHNTTYNTCVPSQCPAGTTVSSNTAAAGGVLTTDVSGYNVHAFKTGTTNIVFPANSTVDILVVGGGGSGGSNVAGGGGAGAVVFYPGYVIPAGTYAVTVGAGAVAQGTDAPGQNGGSSSIGSLFIATGGGGSAWFQSLNGLSGGSGGGAAAPSSNTPSTSTGGSIGSGNVVGGMSGRDSVNSQYVFENIGGSASYPRNADLRDMVAAGGGGAGAKGADGLVTSPYVGGAGGDGVYNVSISGTTYVFSSMFGSAFTAVAQNVGGLYYIAGGGGGGGYGNYGTSYATSAGGKGGGGIGATQSGNNCVNSCKAQISALANTGGGGGGSGANSGTIGGNGGSGLVLIRYALCPPCPAGSFSGSAGSSVCTQCVSGTYANASGSSTCQTCPAAMNGTKTFTYSGVVEQWQVPARVVSINVQMWGAGGGGSSADGNTGTGISSGGGGGYSFGTIAVVPGSFLSVAVGGGGKGGVLGGAQAGGWPNGGASTTGDHCGTGGGRSQISVFSSLQANPTAAISIVQNIAMIAAGGGGAAIRGTTSALEGAMGRGGGGLTGNQNPSGYNVAGTQASLGTCSVSCTGMVYGTLLKGGDTVKYSGAGGDGYYGGSSGKMSWDAIGGGGAGGSSYLGATVLNGGTSAGGDNGAAVASYGLSPNNNNYAKGGPGYSSGWACSPVGACNGQNGVVVITYAVSAANSAAGASQCVICPPNSTFANGTCRCPAGSYLANGTACVQCPAGTYFAPGATTCSACPANQAVYSSQCKCVPGYTGDTTCSLCEPNSFCPGGYANFTVPCLNGTYSPPGSITASQCTCPTNAYYNGSNCTCSAGFYKVLNASAPLGGWQCVICPKASGCVNDSMALCTAGSYASSTGLSACSTCGPGFFSLPNASACLNCAPGAYGPSAGLSQCFTCGPGTFANATGLSACVDCGLGQFSASNATSACTSCAAGTYGNGTRLVSCLSCDAGTATTSAGLSACSACDPGYFSFAVASVCLNCAPGAYGPSAGLTQCPTCGPGTYSSTIGQSVCLDCGPGRFSAGNASTVCTKCAIGTYANATGLSACLGCDANTYASAIGAVECVLCPDNAFAPPFSNTSLACTCRSNYFMTP